MSQLSDDLGKLVGQEITEATYNPETGWITVRSRSKLAMHDDSPGSLLAFQWNASQVEVDE